jgi:hypothetical protein
MHLLKQLKTEKKKKEGATVPINVTSELFTINLKYWE